MTFNEISSLGSYGIPTAVELIVCEYLGRPVIAQEVIELNPVDLSTRQFWLGMQQQLKTTLGKQAYQQMLQGLDQLPVAQQVYSISKYIFFSCAARVNRTELVRTAGEEAIQEMEQGLSLFIPSQKEFQWLRKFSNDTFIKTLCTTVDKTSQASITAIEAMEKVYQAAPGLTSLEFPELETSKLGHLPLEFSFFTGLTQLTVNCQQLTDISVVEFLVNLEQFSASKNWLRAYPIALTKLPKLKLVKLNDNKIEEISPEIENNGQLTTLYLSGNKLKAVPECIHRMQNLTRVYLTKNMIYNFNTPRPNLIVVT